VNTFKKYIKNENGSTTFLTVGILFFGVLLMILFLNIIKMFAVDDRANTSAEQASLAATSVVYDNMMSLIETFSYPCDGEVCYLIEDYDEVAQAVSSNNPSYTASQVEREAIDQLLTTKIPQISDLKKAVKQRMEGMSSDISLAVSNVINENKGNPLGTTIEYFNEDNRILIRTTATFENVEAGFIEKNTEDIENVGLRMEVPFAHSVNWVDKTMIIE